MKYPWRKACRTTSQPTWRQLQSLPATSLPSCNGSVTKLSASMLLALGASCLSACHGPSLPQTADERLVFATLKLLASDGKFVCADSATSGHPLGVFRTTIRNRPAGMTAPSWFVPSALRPPPALTGAELLRGAQSDPHVHIAQPANSTSPLSQPLQDVLNRSAWQLSGRDDDREIHNIDDWHVGGVLARWWVINRIATRCVPNYRLSNPVTSQNIGFITVTADHWATTYAFNLQNAQWVPVAQWSNWLY